MAEREEKFWFMRGRGENCARLYIEFVLPHIADHHELKEIKTTDTRCEFILKKKPLEKKR